MNFSKLDVALILLLIFLWQVIDRLSYVGGGVNFRF